MENCDFEKDMEVESEKGTQIIYETINRKERRAKKQKTFGKATLRKWSKKHQRKR